MKSDNFYLNKYSFCSPQLSVNVPSDLKITIVIPAFAEEKLFQTLESLLPKTQTSFSAEIIVVLNASEKESVENKKINLDNLTIGTNWISKHNSEKIKIHFILNNDLPHKHAGVGLARKIGMDEAVYRFHQIGFDGIIVCADADALYENDFIQKVHDHFFVDNPNSPGCSIYFEHPIQGNEFEKRIYDGIIRYELFLRYYKNSLEWCGFPFAFHTIGSSMAVRSSSYQKSGGMNKKKAGEDFYFLNKIIELGNFTDMISTKVQPSPRVSFRVPFGTGRAVAEWMNKEEMDWLVYHFSIFEELKKMNDQVRDLYLSNRDNFLNLHPLLNLFLAQNDFESKLKEIRINSSSEKFFLKRFYSWMDAFWILKATHFLRDEGMGTDNVENASCELLSRMNLNSASDLNSLLEVFRKIDRKV